MAARCDVKRHMVRRGKKQGILEERMKQCPEERAMVVSTEHGRVGVCAKHADEYNESLLANKGKPTRELKPWARMRRGILIMGDEEALGG